MAASYSNQHGDGGIGQLQPREVYAIAFNAAVWYACWSLFRRRSGGCFASLKRAKPDAESDDFGALCMHVRMLFRFLEAYKTRCRGGSGPSPM